MGRRLSLVCVAFAVSVAVTVSMSGYAPAAVAKPGGASAAAHDRSVAVSAFKASAGAVKHPPVFVPGKAKWPSAGSAVVDLAALPGGGRRGQVTVGGLPVTVSSVDRSSQRAGVGRADAAASAAAPARVRVDVLDRASSARAHTPLALRVSRTDGLSGGAVRVSVDYSAFRDAFGGDWSNRVGLAVVADCAVTTKQCQPSNTPLASAVDSQASVVSADVDLSAVPLEDPAPGLVSPSPTDDMTDPAAVGPVDPYLGSFPVASGPAADPDGADLPPSSPSAAPVSDAAGVVVALDSSQSSQTGDFGKTSLSATGSWQQSGASGALSWSYPIGVPPVPGGLTPDVTIGYSSASIDGLTANENSQTSWLGGGFDYQPGFIERSYMSCQNDTTPTAPYWAQTATMSDLCWRVPNATLSWAGRSTELVPLDSSTTPNTATPTVWRLADDDGTRVEYIADQGTARTGYWHNERWKLTTSDGTQYWFGMTKVPGAGATTDSVLGEAIMGNHAGEPCFSSAAYTSSWCRIAYRWNLDYVVDVHGNAMAYYYTREANGQRIYGGASTYVGYYRSAVLARIEYGLRAGSTAVAPARVVFTSADRCWTDCGTHGSNWPDVPWDLDCAAAPCPTPTFWSTKRLTAIATHVADGTGGYRTVDSYDVGTTAYGTTTGPVVSLEYLQRAGSDSGTGISGSASVPPVIFGYGTAMQNRAWFTAGPGVAESYKFRLAEIRNETGGSLQIAYDPVDPGCTRPAPEPDPDANPYRCFRQWYSDEFNQPQWAWWNKYRVASVTEHDLIGGSPDIVHTYSYATSLAGMRADGQSIGSSSTALWHFDSAAFSSTNALRTWSQWAGYPVVTETTGSSGTVSKTTSVYFTGMDGDRTDAGDNTRSVTVLDTEADHGAANDASYRSGRRYESIVFDGTSVVRKDFTGLTQVQTGSRWWSTTWGSMAPYRTYWAGANLAQTRTPLSGGGWRDVQTLTTFDTDISDGVYGDVLSTNALGDTSTTADDTCTVDTYTPNTATSLIRYDGGTAAPVSGVPLFDTDAYAHMFSGGDFSGDGLLDVLAVKTADGSLWMWPGTSGGGFGTAVSVNASGWNQFDTLLSPGDFTNDGKIDIIGRKTADGTLQLYRGNGTGGLTGPEQVGDGFAQFDLLFSVGDFASNGVGDLLARKPNGDLYLYSGNGSGGWTNGNGGTQINTGWDSYIPFGYKDYTGNSTADILADGPGGLYVYESNGNGTIGTRTPLTGYGTAPTTSTNAGIGGYLAVGNIAGDTTKDLLVQATAHLTGTATQTITYNNACDQPHTTANELRSTAYYYDGSTAWASRPVLGDVTQVSQVKDFTGSTANWITASQTSYDTYGRPVTIKDPRGKATTTAYTESNGLTSQLVVTNPLGHQTTTTLAVGRGVPVTITDPNNNVTTGSYDPLGRMRKMWKPGHVTTGTPDTEYVYTIGYDTTNKIVTAANTAIKTMLPEGAQSTAYEILNGHGHTRQTQSPTADGKRTITDTVYDNRGQVAKTSVFYNNTSGPSSTLVTAADSGIDSQHRYTYDGTGRALTDELWSHDVKQWNVTTTSYNGERTTVDNAAGGTDTTTIADASGRTIELRQYTGTAANGNYTSSRYGYDHAGQLSTVTGPDGAVWTYSYDLLGRKTSTADPDAGTSTSAYDDAGRITSTTDGRSQVLVYDYDDLNRKTDEYATSKSAANQLAHWAYDTVPSGKGQLASATRYVGGNQIGGAAYTRAVTDYDQEYRPEQIELTIPAAEGALAGTYTTNYEYKANGAPKTVTPTTKAGAAVGGLPIETLVYDYNSIGQQTSLGPAGAPYLSSAAYTFDGLLAEQILATGSAQVRHSFTYDPATRRALTSKTETGSGGTWTNKAQDTYAYDQVGNITSIAGTSNGANDQVECFTYDYLRRLTAAWSEGNPPCDIAANQSAGADPYRYAWTFDDTTPDANGVIKTAGLRASETSYNTDGTVRAQSSYTYGGTNKPKHSLASVSTTGTGTGTKTYDYDLSGNTTSRPSPGGAQQSLTWNPEGHLAKVTDSADTTFVYDADGNRLIRHDPGNYTTLTLTDSTELRVNGTGSVAGTRYYGFATRTANTDASGNLTSGTTLTWNITDHHGTGGLAINPTTLQVDHRRSLPFGGSRGTQASGFGTKGFVGGTTDPTGLTHLGAREYDPTTGQFTSADPIFVVDDPQSFNGYAYANNAPTTTSDPTGTIGCSAKCVITKDTPGAQSGDHMLLMVASFIPVVGTLAVLGEAELYRREGNDKAADKLMDAIALETSIPIVGALVPGEISTAVRTEAALTARTEATLAAKTTARMAETSAPPMNDVILGPAPKYQREAYDIVDDATASDVYNAYPYCVYCPGPRHPSTSIDHVEPLQQHWYDRGWRMTREDRSRDVNSTSNLVGCCKPVNSSKAAWTLGSGWMPEVWDMMSNDYGDRFSDQWNRRHGGGPIV